MKRARDDADEVGERRVALLARRIVSVG